jgi:hypothetical protein
MGNRQEIRASSDTRVGSKVAGVAEYAAIHFLTWAAFT